MFFLSQYKIALGMGDSMSPAINNCSLLLIKEKLEPKNIQIGEIIVLNVSDIENELLEYDVIAHRVVDNDIENSLIATRGDNSSKYTSPEQIDGYFHYDKILGKVSLYIKAPDMIC